MCSKGVCKDEEKAQFSRVLAIVSQLREEDACLTVKDLAIDGNDLMTLGFQGREIGIRLTALLEQVLDETLPNDRSTLLEAAQRMTL